MPEAIAEMTLLAHVIAGFGALVMGPFAMFSVKGGPLHRRAGRVHVAAMKLVAATAVALAIQDPNMFLLVIAVLSYFLTFTGYRELLQRDGRRYLDWLVSGLTLMFGVFLIIRGSGITGRFDFLSLAFGITTVTLAGASLLDSPCTWNRVRASQATSSGCFPPTSRRLRPSP